MLYSESEFEGKIVSRAVRMDYADWGRRHVNFVACHLELCVGKGRQLNQGPGKGFLDIKVKASLLAASGTRNSENFWNFPRNGVGMGNWAAFVLEHDFSALALLIS